MRIAQNVDSTGEVDRASSPASRISAIRSITSIGSRLEELKKHGFLNADMSSLELYPGIDLIVAGKLAMGESIGARMPADSKTTQRPDRLHGHAGLRQGQDGRTGRSSTARAWASRRIARIPKAAAAFLEYLQSPERLKVFWEKTGWIPSSTNFDTSVIKDAAVKSMWKNWGEGDNIPYLSNLVPGQFYEQALLPAAQQVVQGKITGEQAGELAAKVAKEWRDFNPDMVDNYKKWAKDLA